MTGCSSIFARVHESQRFLIRNLCKEEPSSGVTIRTYRLCIRPRAADDSDTRRSVRYRRVCNHSATNSLFASFRSWVRIEGIAWRKRSKFLVDQQGKRVAVILDVTEDETGLETRDQPAVDDQLGARDVAAGVARQEDRQPCQLARLAPAAEHRPLADRAPVLLAEFGGHVGKERPDRARGRGRGSSRTPPPSSLRRLAAPAPRRVPTRTRRE